MSDLQAVLFDLDGTLCDTEHSWVAAEFSMAKTYGATWTREDALGLIGQDLLTAGAEIKERMRLEMSAADIVDELLDSVMASLAADGVSWLPGAVELLCACNDAAVPTALVTMSYARFAHAVLASLPAGRFDVVVTGDQVRAGKPAPDAYLKAAGLLGVDPVRCVALEDSVPGAASAEAAGCTVVVVPHHVETPTGPARVVVRSLSDVILPDLRDFLAANMSRR